MSKLCTKAHTMTVSFICNTQRKNAVAQDCRGRDREAKGVF